MSRVFISYSHDDLPWAIRLNDSLNGLGCGTFFDRNSLRAGQRWEDQILGQLMSCDHLVALWSKNAQQSDWVSRERARFDAAWSKLNHPPDPNHVMVHVMLENFPSAYDSSQHIAEISEAGIYAAGADAVPASLWQQVVDRLQDAFGNPSIPVTRAIISVTRNQLSNGTVDFNFQPPGAKSLTAYLDDLNISRADLESYYGSEPQQWKPFGGQHTIQEILEEIRSQLNQVPQATPLRWAPVESELFSSELQAMQVAAAKLANTLSLIIIDPVALYSHVHRLIVQDNLRDCLDNSQAVIAVLPLFAVLPQPRTHEAMVRSVFRSLVDRFYGDFPGPVRLEQAQCSIFTPNDADIKRLVRGTVRHYASAALAPSNVYLNMRGR